MKNAIAKKILPIDATYVRGGSFSAMTAGEINAQLGLDDLLIFKYAPGSGFDRHLVIRFDISKITEPIARLCVKPYVSIDEPGVWYTVHTLEYDGDLKTLTYDNLPTFSEEKTRAMLGGFSGCDISELIAEAKAEGKTEICLVICATKYTDIELRLKNPAVGGDAICLNLYSEQLDTGHTEELTGDKKKDAEIWAWAEKMYAEWREHYEEMLAKPELEAELIESPEEQFTETVYYSSSSKTFDSAKVPAKTRTVAALDDIDNYIPKKEYKIDKFGGLMDESMKQEATGFFYIKKIGKRFWVIDPLGYPFIVRALSQVEPSYQGSAYQLECSLKKYGTLENWGEKISKRLRNGLHFYVSANPSPHVANASEPIIAQKSIGFVYQYGRTIGTANSKGGSSTFSENNTMNVFDPAFVDFAEEKGKLAAAEKDNPYILGYTTDNELPMQSNMILSYLSLDPEKEVNHYSYACAWTWLKHMTGKDNPTENDIAPDFFELFRGFVWDRYYNVVTTAMRKYDPNHMLLGTRFLTGVRNAEWVLKFAGKYLNCITINWYATWQPQAESIYLIAKSANCPFMITEFYTKAGDSGLGNTSGAGQFVATQKDRGMFYQNYTLRLLEATNCVGWHWFQYLDNDPRNAVMPDGRIRDVSSTNSNKGIFSNEHEEYTECTKYMAELNRNVYRFIEYFDKKYGR